MSIIGNAILAGGGGGSNALLIRGAPNEVVTYFGAAAGTVTLDATGDGTVSLRKGTYSFTGSVSGYTKSGVVVDQQTTDINIWPGTALFWYGRQNVTFSYSGQQMPSGYPEYTDDYIKLSRNLSQYAGTFLYAPIMDLTDYTSFHAIGYRTGNTQLGGPLVSTQSAFNFNTSSRVLARDVYLKDERSDITLDISAISGENYVGIGTYTYEEHNGVIDYTYAIWLE